MALRSSGVQGGKSHAELSYYMGTMIEIPQVVSIGYLIIALSFTFVVQTKNVFPQLLLARLLFSWGASCVSTMVSAILPSMVSTLSVHHRDWNRSQNTDLNASSQSNHSRISGLVGLFTGCGALFAVGVLLPLAGSLRKTGLEPENALADVYYISGALSLIVAVLCYVGLLNSDNAEPKERRPQASTNSLYRQLLSFPSSLLEVLHLGVTQPTIGLGFLASFVARASTVGISLFIPLFVNARFCNRSHEFDAIPNHCRKAYTTAAQLTGMAQLLALLFAPVFGFLPWPRCRLNLPLTVATSFGAVGYFGFALLDTSETTPVLFVVVALLGISQTGVIVASLSLVSRFVLRDSVDHGVPSTDSTATADDRTESLSLLTRKPSVCQSYEHLKGSIAGVYSFAGSLAILILTKLGGVLFDRSSPVAPFYLLASFNVLLLVGTLGCFAKELFSGDDTIEQK